jgi:hypothetical protein
VKRKWEKNLSAGQVVIILDLKTDLYMVYERTKFTIKEMYVWKRKVNPS